MKSLRWFFILSLILSLTLSIPVHHAQASGIQAVRRLVQEQGGQVRRSLREDTMPWELPTRSAWSVFSHLDVLRKNIRRMANKVYERLPRTWRDRTLRNSLNSAISSNEISIRIPSAGGPEAFWNQLPQRLREPLIEQAQNDRVTLAEIMSEAASQGFNNRSFLRDILSEANWKAIQQESSLKAYSADTLLRRLSNRGRIHNKRLLKALETQEQTIKVELEQLYDMVQRRHRVVEEIRNLLNQNADNLTAEQRARYQELVLERRSLNDQLFENWGNPNQLEPLYQRLGEVEQEIQRLPMTPEQRFQYDNLINEKEALDETHLETLELVAQYSRFLNLEIPRAKAIIQARLEGVDSSIGSILMNHARGADTNLANIQSNIYRADPYEIRNPRGAIGRLYDTVAGIIRAPVFTRRDRWRRILGTASPLRRSGNVVVSVNRQKRAYLAELSHPDAYKDLLRISQDAFELKSIRIDPTDELIQSIQELQRQDQFDIASLKALLEPFVKDNTHLYDQLLSSVALRGGKQKIYRDALDLFINQHLNFEHLAKRIKDALEESDDFSTTLRQELEAALKEAPEHTQYRNRLKRAIRRQAEQDYRARRAYTLWLRSSAEQDVVNGLMAMVDQMDSASELGQAARGLIMESDQIDLARLITVADDDPLVAEMRTLAGSESVNRVRQSYQDVLRMQDELAATTDHGAVLRLEEALPQAERTYVQARDALARSLQASIETRLAEATRRGVLLVSPQGLARTLPKGSIRTFFNLVGVKVKMPFKAVTTAIDTARFPVRLLWNPKRTFKHVQRSFQGRVSAVLADHKAMIDFEHFVKDNSQLQITLEHLRRNHIATRKAWALGGMSPSRADYMAMSLFKANTGKPSAFQSFAERLHTLDSVTKNRRRYRRAVRTQSATLGRLADAIDQELRQGSEVGQANVQNLRSQALQRAEELQELHRQLVGGDNTEIQTLIQQLQREAFDPSSEAYQQAFRGSRRWNSSRDWMSRLTRQRGRLAAIDEHAFGIATRGPFNPRTAAALHHDILQMIESGDVSLSRRFLQQFSSWERSVFDQGFSWWDRGAVRRFMRSCLPRRAEGRLLNVRNVELSGVDRAAYRENMTRLIRDNHLFNTTSDALEQNLRRMESPNPDTVIQPRSE